MTSAGRVEVLYGGLWGAVCDNRWDLDDANVVCHQLGYPDAVSAPRDSQFGEGTGVIWINNVQCTGREDSLSKCSHSGWGEANCWHNDVASAICSKPGTVINESRPHPSSSTKSAWGSFLESPKRFSHLENHSKISNLIIIQSCFIHIFLI